MSSGAPSAQLIFPIIRLIIDSRTDHDLLWNMGLAVKILIPDKYTG
jgi:hypothetical protein